MRTAMRGPVATEAYSTAVTVLVLALLLAVVLLGMHMTGIAFVLPLPVVR